MAKRKITLTRTVDERQARQLAAEARKRGYKATLSGKAKKKKRSSRGDKDPFGTNGFGDFTPKFNFDR